MGRNSDINEEEVGASTFNLRKAQAVERTISKIRHHLGADWSKLRDDEIKLLEKMLGECWAISDFYEWDKINLSAITFDHVDHIIEVGRRLESGKKSPHESFLEVRELLRGL